MIHGGVSFAIYTCKVNDDNIEVFVDDVNANQSYQIRLPIDMRPDYVRNQVLLLLTVFQEGLTEEEANDYAKRVADLARYYANQI